MTIDEIKKLEPTFVFNGIIMTDWFYVIITNNSCLIKSGLKHVDSEIKSPYYYNHSLIGKNATEKCLKHFNKWWENLNQTNNGQKKKN